jgi:hypothetical protein
MPIFKNDYRYHTLKAITNQILLIYNKAKFAYSLPVQR